MWNMDRYVEWRHNGDIFQTMQSGKYEKEIYTDKSGFTMKIMKKKSGKYVVTHAILISTQY